MDKIFNKPFAINGARVNIPENGTENERVSFDKGFTQPYEVEAPSVDNPAGQGFNILRPEMNEILNQLSNACNFLAENIDKWTALTTENLNDIKQAGRYYQNLNKNATNERNYPENVGGYLIVLNNGIGSYGVTQIYKIWNSERIYIRRTTSLTDWSDWDSLMLTSTANSTYRKIADSYSKSEVNTRTPSLVLSKIGFTYSNIQNATFTIPNNSFLKTCNIQIMFRIQQERNSNTITFNFKNGNSVVASRVFERSSTSGHDYDVCDYISGLASFSITSELLGKTITPSISVTNTQGKFLLNEVDLLITYGS